jgi:hypothetical protein
VLAKSPPCETRVEVVVAVSVKAGGGEGDEGTGDAAREASSAF